MALCIDTSNSSSLFSIARLYSLSFPLSISFCDNHTTRNYTNHKSSFIKVPDIAILNTVFGFHICNTLEPNFKKFRIFILGPLVVIGT